MKKTKFTEQQIAFALRQAETGTRAVFVNIVVARAYAALFNSGCSFSGFNQTFSGNAQFLISPRHRFG